MGSKKKQRNDKGDAADVASPPENKGLPPQDLRLPSGEQQEQVSALLSLATELAGVPIPPAAAHIQVPFFQVTANSSSISCEPATAPATERSGQGASPSVSSESRYDRALQAPSTSAVSGFTGGQALPGVLSSSGPLAGFSQPVVNHENALPSSISRSQAAVVGDPFSSQFDVSVSAGSTYASQSSLPRGVPTVSGVTMSFDGRPPGFSPIRKRYRESPVLTGARGGARGLKRQRLQRCLTVATLLDPRLPSIRKRCQEPPVPTTVRGTGLRLSFFRRLTVPVLVLRIRRHEEWWINGMDGARRRSRLLAPVPR